MRHAVEKRAKVVDYTDTTKRHDRSSRLLLLSDGHGECIQGQALVYPKFFPKWATVSWAIVGIL